MKNCFLFWVDFAGLNCFYFTKRRWPFVFAPKQNLLCTQTTQNSLVCLRRGRKAGGRSTVTWLPNFLGWVHVHYLSYGAPPTSARGAPLSSTAFWRVWCPNEIKINQIILKKKSNVKTESTLGKQQVREIRRVLDSEGGIIMLRFKTRKNNNRDDSQDDFNLQF